jgi:hypothetical protein
MEPGTPTAYMLFCPMHRFGSILRYLTLSSFRVNVPGISGISALNVSESFDEPLTKDQVLAIGYRYSIRKSLRN